jgi:hypothetical protein
MKNPEQNLGNTETELTDDEQNQLDQLEAAADAARVAGVYDPSETEKEK